MFDKLRFLIQRKKERDIDGSPMFTFENTAVVAAGGFYAIDFERDSRYKRYLPFDSLEVVNESDNTVHIWINDRNSKRLPAYGIKGFADIAIWRVRLENKGIDNIAIGELAITAFRSARAEMVKRAPIFGTAFEK